MSAENENAEFRISLLCVAVVLSANLELCPAAKVYLVRFIFTEGSTKHADVYSQIVPYSIQLPCATHMECVHIASIT
jgi:hypothetical protein